MENNKNSKNKMSNILVLDYYWDSKYADDRKKNECKILFK